ncbi:GGDEF domain-containing protein [Rhizobium sp. 2MFCol3.1]|uniref:GGDEF domain-containing protein n=1 Tax=Rhizobium sp. 2MFCol3.1 TaxID=1246459 RepID=UPI000362132C|nr:GGDEF domain-containing protein [Rhizobium sp. 2MFCol3.1]
MNGAASLLVVNFIIAASFGVVFVVVAGHSRSRRPAYWIGAGYNVASLSAICELLVAYGFMPKLWALGAFSSVLIGMVLLGMGIGDLYRKRLAGWIICAFVGASVCLSYLIFDLHRGTPLQAFLYQTPFAIVLLVSAASVLPFRKRSSIDRFLGILLLITGLHFFAKAGLAVIAGAGTSARDYVHTDYAIISQSMTAVLVVAVGLTLLAALILEIMSDQRDESDTDTLSGLFNRRRFERTVQSILERSPDGKHAIILCDLDHFKTINDTFGHHTGDLVIREFGRQLLHHLPPHAVAGRIGGEEFAIFVPDTETDMAVGLAQTLRSATMTLPGLPATLQVTASFGVASLTSPANIAEAHRKADMALYEAKNAGRNRVKIAFGRA